MARVPRQIDIPAYLLLKIREGIADWVSLCQYFDIPPGQTGTVTLYLIRILLQLRAANLLEFKTRGPAGVSFAEDIPEGPIRITEQWLRTQSALDLSLKDLAEFSKLRSIIVNPSFGRPESSKNSSAIFVVMPFQPELQPVYEDHIAAVSGRLNLTVSRADDFSGSHAIMQDVWNAMAGSEIVIADCTGKNPNVFYEIGIAHTLGRPVILITQSPGDVPFDLRHLRYIGYTLTPRGMKLFEESLQQTLVEQLRITR